YGEEVYAAVVLKTKTNSQAIMEFCQKRLALFKVPKKIHVVDRLPRTATNKVQRHLIAQLFSQ
ncbi:MAG: hypothetical protein HY711_07165, partial [Candidatus Melainabacteria bacterium]|nr:hypothetical protein [Candidatus Melainabacteria bacterium]